MRRVIWLLIGGIAAVTLLQFVRPGIPSRPAAAEVQAPPEIRRILEKDCYSCHSDQRRLSWFDQVVPAYWLVRHDILTARAHLDFSTLGSKPAAMQRASLYEAVNMIQLGAMPLPQFVKLHPEARPTGEELAALKAYLAPWGPIGNQPAPAASHAAPISLTAVQPEWNGLAFDPGFENWKPISTTDRGDNHTFRFILGNPIAVSAAQSGNIAPWPDGARFAKIAWQQELGSDGLVHPGQFIQVELMVKDGTRFKSTEGWNWGRWRGLDLKPYGTDSHFVEECTACHQPVHGDDYVYTLPITAAKLTGSDAVNNRAAELPANLPYHPQGWSAITMYVDPSSRTTATLYGNEQAARAAHGFARAGTQSAESYPPGAVLALVTWRQRDDPHWFGARIPDSPESVEFVEIRAAGQPGSYRRFAGINLSEEQPATEAAMQRTSFILGLPPAQLP